MNPRRHLFWSPQAESGEHVFGGDELKAKFIAVATLSVAAMVFMIIGVSLVITRGFTPPTIVGVSHGLVFVSPAEPVSALNLDTDLQQQFDDIVEVLFLRTEAGGVPELVDFVDSRLLNKIEKDFKAADGIQAGFAQTFTIRESRISPSKSTQGKRINYMGVLSSRSLRGNQSSTVYWQCDFSPEAPNKNNATGWRLVGLTSLREDQYFTEEWETERRRRLG